MTDESENVPVEVQIAIQVLQEATRETAVSPPKPEEEEAIQANENEADTGAVVNDNTDIIEVESGSNLQSPKQNQEKPEKNENNGRFLKEKQEFYLSLIKLFFGMFVIIVVLVLFVVYFVNNALSKDLIVPNVVTKVTSSISTEKKDGLCEVNDSKVGDGICDDLANNELCVYDGGDCCLDVTLTDLSFCTTCTCDLRLDEGKLRTTFQNNDVKKLLDPALNFNPIHEEKTVIRVASKEVCSAICTNPDLKNLVNAWSFKTGNGLCSCAWLEATSCYWESITTDIVENDDDSTIAYVQMSKTLHCDCQKTSTKFLVEESKLVLQLSEIWSSWHCHTACQNNQQCTTYSWNLKENECVLMAAEKGQEQTEASKDWISGTQDCSNVDYIKVSDKLLVIAGDSYDDTLSSTEMFDLANHSLNCDKHSLDLPVPLMHATGNVIDKGDGTLAPVICGGNDRNLKFNSNCYSLGDPGHFAQLSEAKGGHASAILDEGKTLWVTGGGTDILVHSSTDHISWKQGYIGPDLAFFAEDHQMVNLDDKAVLLIGGVVEHFNFIYYLSKETWIWQLKSSSNEWQLTKANLATARASFICGRILDSSPDLETTFYLVVATGATEMNQISFPDSTEVLEMTAQEDYHVDDFKTLKWKEGPRFPYRAEGIASVTTVDRKALIAAGGDDIQNQFFSYIHEFQCWNRECVWTKRQDELQTARGYAVAIILPSTQANCV